MKHGCSITRLCPSWRKEQLGPEPQLLQRALEQVPQRQPWREKPAHARSILWRTQLDHRPECSNLLPSERWQDRPQLPTTFSLVLQQELRPELQLEQLEREVLLHRLL